MSAGALGRCCVLGAGNRAANETRPRACLVQVTFPRDREKVSP